MLKLIALYLVVIIAVSVKTYVLAHKKAYTEAELKQLYKLQKLNRTLVKPLVGILKIAKEATKLAFACTKYGIQFIAYRKLMRTMRSGL